MEKAFLFSWSNYSLCALVLLSSTVYSASVGESSKSQTACPSELETKSEKATFKIETSEI